MRSSFIRALKGRLGNDTASLRTPVLAEPALQRTDTTGSEVLVS